VKNRLMIDTSAPLSSTGSKSCSAAWTIIWCLLLLLIPIILGCTKEQQAPPVTLPPVRMEDRWLRHEGKVRWRDTLEKILQREGLPQTELLPFVQAFSAVYDVRKINAEKMYQVYTDSAGVWKRWDYLAESEVTIQVQSDSLGRFSGREVRLALVKKVRALAGVLNSSLYESVLALGETPELIIRYSDVFQWDLDFFSDPQPGDEFRIVYEAYYVKDASRPDSVGPFVRYGRVLVGEYRQPQNRLVAVYFQMNPERGGYYDLTGKSFQKTFRKSPLSYGRVTSRFSGARLHPILKIVRAHYAIDIAAPQGTPVMAPADGTIIERGYNASIGNYLKIRHRNPHFVTLYGHLSAFADSMTVGKQVRQSDEVGYVGSTGLSTGPHLHYVFYENGHPINPERIKNSSGDPLPAERLAEYAIARERMLSWLSKATGRPAFIDTTLVMPMHVAGADTVLSTSQR
jgi:murein DD-endopeptidase MepM/ murein hydrolase activator NlpD